MVDYLTELLPDACDYSWDAAKCGSLICNKIWGPVKNRDCVVTEYDLETYMSVLSLKLQKAQVKFKEGLFWSM